MIWAVIVALFLGAPVAAQEAVARFGDGETRMVLRSTTDIRILAPLMERFAAANPDLAVEYEQWGSNDLFVASSGECATGAAGADAILSSAVQQMVWLVNAACGFPYKSAQTATLPPERRWRDELWGVTEEPAVILYNKDRIAGEDVPRSRFRLLDTMRADPDLVRGRIATYDIKASGLGYLFAHVDSQEANTFGAMLESFARVDAVATCCSAEIIEGVAEGRYLIAYNVLGSYVEEARDAKVGVVLPEDYTLVLSRGFMIPKGAGEKAGAARLLDFLLSDEARPMLEAANLRMVAGGDETGLQPSARRLIPLSPTLLVALDKNRRETLYGLWENAFDPAQE